MILISKGRLGPDLWSEISDQAKSIKDMMRIV